jgi:hypothetical protein
MIKHTRMDLGLQGIDMVRRLPGLLFAVLVALIATLAALQIAAADTTGTTAVTVLPADGNARGVFVRDQTVDITMTHDAEGVWAHSQVWLRLSNPFSGSAQLPVTFMGAGLQPGGLPADLVIRQGDAILPTQPGSRGDILATLTIPGRSQSVLALSYRQLLTETRGLVTFGYPLAAVQRWAAAPESARVTISFPTDFIPEQLIAEKPEPLRATGQTLTWQWDGSKPTENVWLAFLSPAWWKEFADARDKAGQPTAGAVEHLTLSNLYRQLSSLPTLPFVDGVDFAGRYYPSVVAELQAAAQAASGGNAQTAAHAALARVYLDQAKRLGLATAGTFLRLADNEANAAFKGGADDDDLRKTAGEILLQLADVTRAGGDAALAETYLERLSALEKHSAAPESQAPTAARLSLAMQALARGDLPGARQMVTQTYGAAALEVPGARSPLADQAIVTVDTMAGERSIRLTLSGGANPRQVADLLAEAATVANQQITPPVTAGVNWLSIQLPFGSAEELAANSRRLGEILPAAPELALLHAVLTPDVIAMRSDRTFVRTTWRYLEQIDLTGPMVRWQAIAGQFQGAAARPTPPPQAGTGATDVAQVQYAVWSAEAVAWQNLARQSRVDYTVHLEDGKTSRQWQVPAGTARTLVAEASLWRVETLQWLLIPSILLILIVALAIWRLT